MRPVVKVTLEILAVPALLITLVLAWFAPNIKGYYRWQHYCEAEGGLRIYHKLQKGVPWQTDHFGGWSVASHGTVPFVRVKRSGHWVEMRYRGGAIDDERSYDAVATDAALATGYELRLVSERLPKELRLSRTGYEIRDIETGQLMVSWHRFTYSRFEQDRTLLAAPSRISCGGAEEFFDAKAFNTYFYD